MAINIGLSDSQRKGVVAILTALLADETLLYIKTRNYHWNVVGPQFNDLHKFFESQYQALEEKIDDIAERIRSLGANATGAMTEYVKTARLKEQLGRPPAAQVMLSALLMDHEAMIRQLRKDAAACDEKFGDAGNNDFLTGLMEDHEKMAWMLRSFLSK